MALTIVTNPVSSITTGNAVCGGNSISTPTGTITAKGVCWSTSANPTIALSTKTTDGTGNGNFTSTLTSLASSTTYYVRAYVTELVGSTSTTYYGANVVFTTLGLTTTAATSITSTTATSGASAINGFSSINAVGVCWSTSSNPDINNNHTTDVLIGNTCTSYLTGLAPGTQYYIRAYVLYYTAYIYGDQKLFNTLTSTPVVTTTAPNIITSTTANPNGNVVSIGGASLNIIKRGVCYSTSSTGIDITVSPTSFATQVSQTGTYSTGVFTSLPSITGLTPATTYYYRAYAINSDSGKYAYGEQKNFTTLGGPTVETVIPYSITSSTVQVGCNILNLGGSTLTARGVVISTSPDPTLVTGTVYTDSYPGNANPYLIKLTGLTKDTTYYIKGYATNSQGTGYGEELIFSTTSCNPLTEECDPQQFPEVECTDTACEYIIPLACIEGEVSSTECSNVIPENPTLLSSLIKINELLCNISSKEFSLYFLSTIASSQTLSTIFCGVIRKCTVNTATVRSDSGALVIQILSITTSGTSLIGRTITTSGGGIFQTGTIITDVEVGTTNGSPGGYKISKTTLSAATGQVATLVFT